jgi:translation initiation factor 2 subunit 2
MKRDPMHVLGFYRNELGCNGTIGNDDMLILNGAYQQKHFIRIIKKYFEVYLKCDVCNGYDTILEKDTKTRLEYLRCNCCKASRTVPPITKTFEAARRGERRKNR